MPQSAMRRFRIHAVSTAAAFASALVVVWIAWRIEMRNAHEAFARMQANMPRALDSQGDQGSIGWVAGSAVYGPGLFTLFLAILAFVVVFRCLNRWQSGGQE